MCPAPVSSDTEHLFIRILGVGFLASMALSHQFWVGARTFPPLPIIPGLSAPDFLRHALALVLALSLAGAVFRPSRAFVIGAIGAFTILGLFDVTAVQPWAYQYALMLGALTLARPGDGVTLVRWILGLTYIWSALHKLNPGFFETIVPLFHPLGPPTSPIPSGVVMISVELGIGVGLLWMSAAQAAAVLAVLMHASILLLRSADGSNVVVWPWNVVAAALAVQCAWSVESVSWREVFTGRGRLVLILCGFLPALGAFGLWDPYPSFMLYTGNVDRATLTVQNADAEALGLLAFASTGTGTRTTALDSSEWPLRELRLPGYPAPWAHKRLAAVLCERVDHPEQLRMVIHHRLTLLRPVRTESAYRCDL